jgi:hypothetical protein
MLKTRFIKCKVRKRALLLPILVNNIMFRLPVNKYMQNIDTKEAYLDKA